MKLHVYLTFYIWIQKYPAKRIIANFIINKSMIWNIWKQWQVSKDFLFENMITMTSRKWLFIWKYFLG